MAEGTGGGLCLIAAVVGAVLSSTAPARAGSLDLGDNTTFDYKLTVSYGVAMRTKSPSGDLINGPVDPFQLQVIPTANPGQPFQVVGFTHTGLATTVNFDDGDRNFKRFSLINDRISGLAEIQLTHGNYGFVGSADGFYDDVYHRGNDDTSPLTANVTGNPTKFTAGTKWYDGNRTRFLEGYVYGGWNPVGNINIDLRVGKQVVAYGESLFFPGISGAQGTADATKAFVPGAEIKEILLPSQQISTQIGITNALSVLGYYKLDFKPNEIFPEGDYFSPADAVGPGSTFVYGSANPLSATSGCTGLLQSITVAGVPLPTIINPALESTICQGVLASIGNAAGAPPFIYSYRAPDIRPTRWGQFGVAVKYQLEPDLNVGLYYLRYSDPNPTVALHYGYAEFTSKPEETSQLINLSVPTTYSVKYFDGIHLFGGSFSTVAGPFNVGGDIIYRDGAGLPGEAEVSGVVTPIYERGREGSVQASAIYAANPNFFYDDLAWVTETSYHHLFSIDQVASFPGQIAIADGRSPFYSINAWGIQTLVIPTKHNLLPGWDFSTPMTFAALVKGTPELAGAFGALYGAGDERLGISANVTYLQNLQFGIGYNFFFGDPSKTIGNSVLKVNPYADRDYATFNVKYEF